MFYEAADSRKNSFHMFRHVSNFCAVHLTSVCLIDSPHFQELTQKPTSLCPDLLTSIDELQQVV